MQSAIRSLQTASYNLNSAISSLQLAVCSLESEVCDLQSAVCGLQRVTFKTFAHSVEQLYRTIQQFTDTGFPLDSNSFGNFDLPLEIQR